MPQSHRLCVCCSGGRWCGYFGMRSRSTRSGWSWALMRISLCYAIEEIVALHETSKGVAHSSLQRKMVRRVLVGMTPKDTLLSPLIVRVLAGDCDFIPSWWEIHGAEAIGEFDFAIRRNAFDAVDSHARLFAILFNRCSNSCVCGIPVRVMRGTAADSQRDRCHMLLSHWSFRWIWRRQS